MSKNNDDFVTNNISADTGKRDDIENVENDGEKLDEVIKQIEDKSIFDDLKNNSQINEESFNQGDYFIVQLDDNTKFEYHILKNNQYINSIYFEHQSGFNPNLTIREFNSHVFLIFEETIGKGTGLLETEEVWYDISVASFPEVLRYTTYFSYFGENYPRNTLFQGEITAINEAENDLEVELKFTEKVFNSATDNEMLSFTYEHVYTLKDDAEAFIKEFYPKTGLLYNHNKTDLEFLIQNYDELVSLINSDNTEKREWAKKFINSERNTLEDLDKLSGLCSE